MTVYKKIQIIAEVFGERFTPYVKVYGDSVYYYAFPKSTWLTVWNWYDIKMWQGKLDKHNAVLGVNLDKQAFLIHFLNQ